MEKIISSFDSITEWADMIAFLTRVQKLLQTFKGFNAIPKKMILAKRLSQCLNPALPPRVHTKVLHVYKRFYLLLMVSIFQNQGVALENDLNIWSMGLFPFTINASMAVRPVLIELYKEFFVPLGKSINVCMKGFILAILPFFEEESNEFFEPASDLLEKIAKSTSYPVFYAGLWSAIISTPSCRISAIHYLLKKMVKIQSSEDMVVVIGDTGPLADAICKLIEDGEVLVKRGALELLVTQFAFENSSFTSQEKRKIIKSAITVVLARNMSLNLRMYTLTKDYDDVVIGILKEMFNDNDSTLMQKPYKILMSFLDRANYGDKILDAVMVEMLTSLYQHCLRDEKISTMLLSTATGLFAAINPYLFWKNVHFWILEGSEISIKVVSFIISNFTFAEEETQKVHLPFFYFTLTSLTVSLEESDDKVAEKLQLAASVSKTISNTVLTNSWNLSEFRGPSQEENSIPTPSPHIISPVSPILTAISVKDISLIYMSQDGSDRNRKLLFQRIIVGRPIMEESFVNLITLLSRYTITPGESWKGIWKSLCLAIERHILCHVDENWLRSEWLEIVKRNSIKVEEFEYSQVGFIVYISVYSNLKQKIGNGKLVLQKLWEFLTPANSKYYVKIIQIIMLLSTVCGVAKLEQELGLILQSDMTNGLKKFGILWKFFERDFFPGFTFSFPICVIFNDFMFLNSKTHVQAKNWILAHVASIIRLIKPLMDIITHSEIIFDISIAQDYTVISVTTLQPFNQAQVDYAFDVLLLLIQSNQMGVCESLSSVYCVDKKAIPKWPEVSTLQPLTYLDILVLHSLQFLLSQPMRGIVDSINFELQGSIKRKVSHFLRVVMNLGGEKHLSKPISIIVYRCLLASLDQDLRPEVFGHILKAIETTSGIVFKRTTFGQLYTRADAKSQVVASLLKFLKLSYPDYYAWFSCILSHHNYFAPHFESTLLICIQKICSRICGLCSLISDNLNETGDAELQALLTGLDMILAVTLGSEYCKAECLKIATEICGCLFEVFKCINIHNSLFQTKILDTIGSVVKNGCAANPGVFLEAIIFAGDKWSPGEDTVFEILRFAELSNAVIASSIFDALKGRIIPVAEFKQSNLVLLEFLPRLIKKTEEAQLINFWSSFSTYLKEICLHQTLHLIFLPTLRILDAYFGVASVEARKSWRDTEELYVKVAEICTNIAAKCFEKSEKKLIPSANTSPGDLESVKYGLRPVNFTSIPKTDDQLAKEIIAYFGEESLLSLRTRLDQERVLQILSSLSQTVIIPALKGKDVTKTLLQGPVLKILTALISIPFGFKTWKREAWASFMDPRFFMIASSNLRQWKTILHALILYDQEHFTELLARMSSASSGMFSSRDNEFQERACMFRKLSFLIFSAPVDYYSTKLPLIQEKIGEALKLGSSVLKTEVLFCLQILLIRVSSKTFSSIWLVCNYELIRVFAQNIETLSKTKEELALLLEACRLLFLVMHLDFDEFQWSKWIFVSDLTDKSRSSESRPPLVDALLDKIDTNLATTDSKSNFMALKVLQTPIDLQPFFRAVRLNDFTIPDLNSTFTELFSKAELNL